MLPVSMDADNGSQAQTRRKALDMNPCPSRSDKRKVPGVVTGVYRFSGQFPSHRQGATHALNKRINTRRILEKKEDEAAETTNMIESPLLNKKCHFYIFLSDQPAGAQART